MASEEVPRLLAGLFNRSQRTRGGNHMTKRELQPHAFTFAFCAVCVAAVASGTAGTPLASAAWKASGGADWWVRSQEYESLRYTDSIDLIISASTSSDMLGSIVSGGSWLP
jgi:hypothetical protein